MSLNLTPSFSRMWTEQNRAVLQIKYITFVRFGCWGGMVWYGCCCCVSVVISKSFKLKLSFFAFPPSSFIPRVLYVSRIYIRQSGCLINVQQFKLLLYFNPLINKILSIFFMVLLVGWKELNWTATLFGVKSYYVGICNRTLFCTFSFRLVVVEASLCWN